MTLNTSTKVILSIVFSILFLSVSLLFGSSFLHKIFDNDLLVIVAPVAASLILGVLLVFFSLGGKSKLERFGITALSFVLLVPLLAYILWVFILIALGDSFWKALLWPLGT